MEKIKNRKELLVYFKNLLEEDYLKIKNEIDEIKKKYYFHLDEEVKKKKNKFIKQGGKEEYFEMEKDTLEDEFKSLLKIYKKKKSVYNEQIKKELESNLEKKKEIISKIRSLINSTENIREITNKFSNYNNQWIEITNISVKEEKNLYEEYHKVLDEYYSFLKIYNELRILDFKSNLQAKKDVINKIKKLTDKTDIIAANKDLLIFRKQWMNIGPVEQKEKIKITKEFYELNKNLNKKHNDYFDKLKKEADKIIEEKKKINDVLEKILKIKISSENKWGDAIKKVIELQQKWRKLGFVHQKEYNKIQKVFRDNNDNFFKAKHEFSKAVKDKELDNLAKKNEICDKIESLKEVKNWKKATEFIIELQQKWGKIEKVPFNDSQESWVRFRAVSDKFFNEKKKYFKNIDKIYEENLNEKKQIIKQINAINNNNTEELINEIDKLKTKWNEIGFVDMKMKNKIENELEKTINEKLKNSGIDKKEKEVILTKQKFSQIKDEKERKNKIREEKEKIKRTIKYINNEVTVVENNLGFFSSKSKSPTIDKYKKEIEEKKEKIKTMNEKLKILNRM